MVRRIVVLPQPDGPRIEKNSPPAIFSVTSFDRDEVAEADRDVVEIDVRAHAPAAFSPFPERCKLRTKREAARDLSRGDALFPKREPVRVGLCK